MALKQDGIHFLICPKHGNKILGVVLNEVFVVGILCQGQNFSAAQSCSSTPSPLLPGLDLAQYLTYLFTPLNMCFS